MVDVWLPYGKTDVCVRVPARNLIGSITSVQKPGVPDLRGEIERAIREPIGSKLLEEFVNSGSKVVIVVDDSAMGFNEVLLLSLLSELNGVGVSDENVVVVFGCESRLVRSEEFSVFLGEEVLRRVKVINNDVKGGDLVFVGTTKQGNKVGFSRVFVEADVRILLGGVSVHYYAGYSGGRKTVMSGVCGVETVRCNSVMMLNSNACGGVLEGNPVHEDMMEVARLARVDFIVNVVENSRGELVKAFAGDMEAAFFEAVKLVDEMCKVRVDRRADIVVVSAGGNPWDGTLYQACKVFDNVLDVVKRGGVVVLVAECSQGHGNQVFYDWMLRLTDLKSIEKEIKRSFSMGGHRAYYLLKVLQNHPVILVSALPDYYAVNMFKLKTARAINDALTEAFKMAGSASRVWTIPVGSQTLPEYKAPEEAKT